MKKTLNATIFFALLVFAGCKKDFQPSSNDDQQISLTRAAGQNASSLNLTVTIDNTTGIASDGGGDYIHGTDRVSAQILGSDGNFFLQTNTNTKKALIRKLGFPDAANYEQDVLHNRNYTIRTDAAIPLQNMTSGQMQQVGLTIRGTNDGDIDWVLRYRNETFPTTVTDKAIVTKNADGSWTIEPAGLSDPAATGALFDSSPNGFAIGDPGFHVAPFRITLRTN